MASPPPVSQYRWWVVVIPHHNVLVAVVEQVGKGYATPEVGRRKTVPVGLRIRGSVGKCAVAIVVKQQIDLLVMTLHGRILHALIDVSVGDEQVQIGTVSRLDRPCLFA